MKKLTREQNIFVIKFAIVTALSVTVLFLLYSVIGYLSVWFMQPRFVGADGTVTASWGFLIQFMIFSAFLVIAGTALVLCAVKFFVKNDGKSGEGQKKTASGEQPRIADEECPKPQTTGKLSKVGCRRQVGRRQA